MDGYLGFQLQCTGQTDTMRNCSYFCYTLRFTLEKYGCEMSGSNCNVQRCELLVCRQQGCGLQSESPRAVRQHSDEVTRQSGSSAGECKATPAVSPEALSEQAAVECRPSAADTEAGQRRVQWSAMTGAGILMMGVLPS